MNRACVEKISLKALKPAPNNNNELTNFSGVQIHFVVCSTFLSDPLRYGMIRRRSNKSIYPPAPCGPQAERHINDYGSSLRVVVSFDIVGVSAPWDQTVTLTRARSRPCGQPVSQQPASAACAADRYSVCAADTVPRRQRHPP